MQAFGNNNNSTTRQITPTQQPLYVNPPAVISSGASITPSCLHLIDQEAIQSWIYPANRPKRLYQFNIVQRALFTNTLVCLPTGLGKTFIAAVLMYNYYRWFPEGKIVFM
jgi:hypothetical protein